MKTLSKMVVIGGVLIVASLLTSNTTLGGGSEQTTITATRFDRFNFAVVLDNRASPLDCRGTDGFAGIGYWAVDHRTTAGARMMDILMRAYASGRPVYLYCNGIQGNYNNITAIYTY